MPVTVKKFFQVLLIVLVFLGLAMASAVITMNAFTWGHTITVPDVRGKELTTAINQIRNSGLDIKVERQEHHPTVPENYIIGQSPAPGERVKGGRNVMVVVSLGSEEMAVPPVTDKVFRLAQVTLKSGWARTGRCGAGELAVAPGDGNPSVSRRRVPCCRRAPRWTYW